MEKNNEQVKNIWKPLCLVMAALLALSWVFFGFLYSKGGVDFSTLETPEQVQTDNGSPVTDENGEQLPSDETIPMPSALAFSSAAALDGANAEYDSVTLTATVKPDTVTNKEVDWTVAFVNPSSAWANGKTVTDYVTVTPTSDGSTIATVQCLKDFGEQIEITVQSRDNENAKASCTVDFRKRVVDITFTGSVTKYAFSEEDSILTLLEVKANVEFFHRRDFSCTYSAFTVDDTSFAVQNIAVQISSVFLDAMVSAGLTKAREATESVVGENATIVSALGSYVEETANIMLGFGEPFNKFITAMQSVGDEALATVTVSFVGDNSSFEKIYSVKADSSALTLSVESVSLDQSNVVI